MRVCVLSEFFHPDNTGGTGPVVSRIARNFADNHGAEVEVVTSRRSYRDKTLTLKSDEDWEGIHIHRVDAPDLNLKGTALRTLGNLIFALRVALRLLFSRSFDVVFVTTAPPFLPIAADLCRMVRRTPYVYVVYDLEPDRVVGLKVMPSSSPLVRAMRRLQRRWLTRAAKVVPIGRCMADLLHDNYRLSFQRMSVVAVGAEDVTAQVVEGRKPVETVTSDEIASQISRGLAVQAVTETMTGKAQALHDHLSGPDHLSPKEKQEETGRTFTITYSGNFGRYHDFDLILDAAKLLQAEKAPVKFILAGQGVQKRRVEERVAKEQIRLVETRDFVPSEDYADVLASSDACLVTMEAGLEGTCVPSKFYSIMSAGKPTLALVSERSEVAKTIEEYGCGLRIDQKDVRDLARVVKTLMDSPSLAEDMGRRARSTYLERFTSENSAATMFSVLTTVARRTQAPDRAGAEHAADLGAAGK